jgi:hypothetical protein
MFALLSRTYGVKQTTGCLYVFDGDRAIFNCLTIELPYLENQQNISCITEGIFRAYKLKSPKFGESIHLLDVPGREGILIHKGNYAAGSQIDTRGCILPGLHFEDINGDGNIDVAESTKAMTLLLAALPKTFKIIIL